VPPGDQAPLISVIICTHNRADFLRRAIRSVIDQSVHPSDFEIIVVDNGSTDATRDVVREFEAAGNMSYVFEAALGLCHARNSGWRSARGRYLAYLDDDAIALPGWLAAIKDAFAATPAAGVVGGRVEPIWEGERPSWLSEDVARCLTVLDWSATPKVITDVRVEWLVGANMAIPATVMVEMGGFHPGLDRVGRNMLSSGDVFLQKQIIRRGYVCLYQPAMAVRHVVPAARLSKKWFRRRYYWQGISDAVMQLIEDSPSAARRTGGAAALAVGLLRSPRALLALVLPTDDPVRFTLKCFTWIAVGHIAGLLGAARR